jgi:hypothetical protein
MNFPAKTTRNGERGAALVSTLLIAALLLAAGGMLILTTSMTGTNTIDAAAEMQAYYGAEAGLQATLNVLRGGTLPNPLFVANPVGTVASENIIDFRKALTRNTSNLASDPTSADIRLSRWLTYNYTPAGGTYADRVAISPGYTPFNGVAYSIQLADPDATPVTRPPQRLIIEATGYGPRNARKTLSMMVSANGLNITVPAALVIRGHDNANTDATIDLGNSNAKTYSGVDNAGIDATKPSLAVSGHDVDTAQEAYAQKPGTVANPKVNVLDLPYDPGPAGSTVVDTPWFLETADAARQFLVQAENLANSCAAPGSPCKKRGVIVNSLNGNAGTTTSPQFTIVKGDCNLDGGAGLLIVTGTLTFDGPGPNFNGLILVLGDGVLLKSGGGNRDIFGSIMVARFGPGGNFLAPTFNYTGGGGSSNIQYDSSAVLDAIVMPGANVLGVVEKLPEL